ncbi:hypothetical protein BUALT_Bualt09G0026100 [Buddleja alternifolia]|uniref:Profilin n=1 Tax=Buddleja alternifolia TaxID=168488 RepID=A0AAV6X0K6_9LAMI|nr:hypothetical protein BUALT_Bualt09G0026100 [Buddleja alternifolia]
MSWHTYVDDHLMCDIEGQPGHRLSAAAILGLDGAVKASEISGIVTDLNEPGHLARTGLYIGGTKYMVIQGEPQAVIRGKKVYEEPVTPGQCNMVVERLADYLIDQGL